MKASNVLMAIIALFISPSTFATTYQPLARCEGGQVALERLIEADPKYNSYQIVVRGAAFAQHVASVLTAGSIEDRGQSYVLRFHDLNAKSPDTFIYHAYAVTRSGELQAVVDYYTEGPQHHTGNYVFRGCVGN